MSSTRSALSPVNGDRIATRAQRPISNYFPNRKRHSSTVVNASSYPKAIRAARSIFPLPKQTATIQWRCLEQLPLGYFSWLPNEVLHWFFSECTVVLLGQFAMVSREISLRIYNFLLSHDGRKKISQYLEMEPKQAQFRKLGVLYKRLTFLCPTQKRLNEFLNVSNQYAPTHDLLKNVVVARLWGEAGHSFIAGWERHECTKYYNLLYNNTNMTELRSLFLINDAGSSTAVEEELCTFYRALFTEQRLVVKASEDAASILFWVKTFLARIPEVTDRSKMLFLFFGPRKLPNNELMWSEMGDSYPGAYTTAHEWFGKLCVMLRTMSKSTTFGLDLTISLFHMMIEEGDVAWLSHNIASVLVLIKDKHFVYQYLLFLCKRNSLADCANIIREIVVTIHRFRSGIRQNAKAHSINSVTDVFDVIKNLFCVIRSEDCVTLVKGIVKSHGDTLSELKDETDPERIVEFNDEVAAFGDFLGYLMTHSFFDNIWRSR